MGTCTSRTASVNDKVNKRIQKELDEEARNTKKEIKLLLLGPGESGKSTVFKQMKIIQDNGGYSKEELSAYKQIVLENCVSQMKVLITAAEKLQIDIKNKDNKERAQRVLSHHSMGVQNVTTSWSLEMADDIRELWEDPGIQEAFEERHRYQLNDSAQYFFSKINEMRRAEYVPTVDDILRARMRTKGIEEAEFTFGNLKFRMMDVGGQRIERRKWLHCFAEVTAVIFCVSLSEYNQNLREDDTQNRMVESLMLFHEICNSKYFRTTPFILFLNKTDLFREKIQKIDLSVCFPNYTGGLDHDRAAAFVRARFQEQNLRRSSHVVFDHFTCATSTENVSFVFKSVRETILSRTMVDNMLT